MMTEGSLEVKLPTSDIWTDAATVVATVRKERARRKKIKAREKVEKSRDTVLHTVVAETHFQDNMSKAPQRRSTFGSGVIAKVHAVVTQSTFPSQNAKNTAGSERFWQLSCSKSACGCGAKRVPKSKAWTTF